MSSRTRRSGSVSSPPGCVKYNRLRKLFNHAILPEVPAPELVDRIDPFIDVWASNVYRYNSFGQPPDEIFSQFSNYRQRFRKNKSGNYYMDLRYISCDILNELGITNVTISKSCTYNDNFYSYRKDKTTGRFVSLIWFKK